MPEFSIALLTGSPSVVDSLGNLLITIVADGGSVGFMHPLAKAEAAVFWNSSLQAAGHGERIVLGAWQNEILVGTVTLLLALPPNQPHRAEIAKLMTHPSQRGRGIAAALVRRAEALAIELGRSLLVLDTAVDGGASGLYEGLGFSVCGTIPDYALKPHGGLTATRIYYKRIGPHAPPA